MFSLRLYVIADCRSFRLICRSTITNGYTVIFIRRRFTKRHTIIVAGCSTIAQRCCIICLCCCGTHSNTILMIGSSPRTDDNCIDTGIPALEILANYDSSGGSSLCPGTNSDGISHLNLLFRYAGLGAITDGNTIIRTRRCINAGS